MRPVTRDEDPPFDTDVQQGDISMRASILVHRGHHNRRKPTEIRGTSIMRVGKLEEYPMTIETRPRELVPD